MSREEELLYKRGFDAGVDFHRQWVEAQVRALKAEIRALKAQLKQTEGDDAHG